MIISQNCKYILTKIYKTELIQIFLYISFTLFIIGNTLNLLNVKELGIFKQFSSMFFLLATSLQTLVLISAVQIFNYKSKIINILSLNRFKISTGLLSIMFGFIIYFTISALIELSSLKIPGYGVQQDYLQYFGTDKYSILISILTVVIIAPIAEEIFFRGFLFNKVKLYFSNNYTNLISSLCFATIHLQPNVIIPLFILGFIIGTIRIKTNSVIPCIIFHALNNGLALYAQYHFLQ